jgi:hypothetical protein
VTSPTPPVECLSTTGPFRLSDFQFSTVPESRKLEAIPGFDIFPSDDRFREIIKQVGVAIIGQTNSLGLADNRHPDLFDDLPEAVVAGEDVEAWNCFQLILPPRFWRRNWRKGWMRW